jgi:hypothetical protein
MSDRRSVGYGNALFMHVMRHATVSHATDNNNTPIGGSIVGYVYSIVVSAGVAGRFGQRKLRRTAIMRFAGVENC